MFAGDRLPDLLVDVAEDGRPLDFTGWTVTVQVDGPVSSTGPSLSTAPGVIARAWQAGETDFPGDYAVILYGTSPAPQSYQRTWTAEQALRIEQP